MAGTENDPVLPHHTTATLARDSVLGMGTQDIRAAFQALRDAAGSGDPDYWTAYFPHCGLTAAEFAVGYLMRQVEPP